MRESKKERRERLAAEASVAVAAVLRTPETMNATETPEVPEAPETPEVPEAPEATDAGADARRAASEALSAAVASASSLRASGDGAGALSAVRSAAALAREAGIGGARATYADRGVRDPLTGRRAVSLYGILRGIVSSAGAEGADRASLVSGLRTEVRRIEAEAGATGPAAIPDERFADRVRLFFRATREAESFVSSGGSLGRKVTLGESRGIREAAGNGRLYAPGFLPAGERAAALA